MPYGVSRIVAARPWRIGAHQIPAAGTGGDPDEIVVPDERPMHPVPRVMPPGIPPFLEAQLERARVLDERERVQHRPAYVPGRHAGALQAPEESVRHPIDALGFYAWANQETTALLVYQHESGIEVRFHMRSFHLAILYTMRMPVPVCSPWNALSAPAMSLPIAVSGNTTSALR